MIVENINSNFLDYRKFFNMVQKVLKIYDKDSQTYKLVISLYGQIAKGLLRGDAQTSEMMFE